MPPFHFVRVGLFGQVGRFVAADGACYPRRSRVICRTDRGVEVGEVLSVDDTQNVVNSPAATDGTLLRRVTVEDELLLARLDRHKQDAFHACQRLLRDRGSAAVLMDVEHLFDGRGLYFYFLGEVPPDVETLTGQLAAAYDAEVQFQRFAETLTAGCGPGCGTAEAAGQGCGPNGCATCAIAHACGSK